MNLLKGPIMYHPPSYTPADESIFLESVLYFKPYWIGSTVPAQYARPAMAKTMAVTVTQQQQAALLLFSRISIFHGLLINLIILL
jgi:hypothetical protein